MNLFKIGNWTFFTYWLKKCEICGRNRIWFLVKRRSISVQQIGTPLFKDDVCDKCFKLAKKYFSRLGIK